MPEKIIESIAVKRLDILDERGMLMNPHAFTVRC